MRILAFYPYLPYPLDRGAYYRGFHLLRHLAGAHDIDLLALCEHGDGAEHRDIFTDFCHRVELVSFQHPPWQRLFPTRLRNPLPASVAHWTLAHAARTLERLLATERYDAVHAFDLILAQYFLGPRAHGLQLIVDRTRVDLQYQLMEWRRLTSKWKARLLALEHLFKQWRFERRVARLARLEVVCGPDDADFLRRFVSPSLDIAVIPNGVDIDYFNPGAAPEGERAAVPTLLFCGAMDYNPNVDALRWYFGEIHHALARAIPELQMLIVGKEPGPEIQSYGRLPRVTVTGAVPDVRPYYRRAWLQVVPLRIGGGTRLKIVESMAMGTPVVSTTVGAQGLGLEHDRDVLLADSAPDFVRQTARALLEPKLRRQIELAGLDAVRGRLSWPRLGQQLCEVYARIGNAGAQAPGTRQLACST